MTADENVGLLSKARERAEMTWWTAVYVWDEGFSLNLASFFFLGWTLRNTKGAEIGCFWVKTTIILRFRRWMKKELGNGHEITISAVSTTRCHRLIFQTALLLASGELHYCWIRKNFPPKNCYKAWLFHVAKTGCESIKNTGLCSGKERFLSRF